jgi:thimet oligopeptidase
MAKKDNILLFQVNDLIKFDKLDTAQIKNATQFVIENSKKQIDKISQIEVGKRNFTNTMAAYDDLYSSLNSVTSIIYLMAYTHPDSAIRSKSQECIEILSKFDNELNLNEDLYRATSEYSKTEEAKKLIGFKKKFLDERMKFYALNGFNLPKEKRDELKIIFDSTSSIGLEFSANIAAVKDYIEVTEEEIKGLPDDYRNDHKLDNGKYKIDLSYPSFVPFMQLSENDEARRKLSFLYLNRATDKNLPLLQKLLTEREKAAKILGFKTAAEYMVAENMAKTPDKIWDFENSLLVKVKPKAEADYKELLELKQKTKKNAKDTIINSWEYQYLLNKQLKEKYSVDQQKVKEYFEVNNVIKGILLICSKLYNVEFKEVPNAPAWHSDVKLFEMTSNGNLLARIYLDLYPRDDKYGHYACFGMIHGKQKDSAYQVPTAALVCNFPKATKDMPGLLSHDNVTTFFHEFGHMMHFVFSRSELATQSGITNTHEFVEVPSQFFENWAWNYESLKLFAKHYKTGKVLPVELHKKMWDARNLCSGIDANRQIFYGMLDMTYHDKYIPEGTTTTTEALKELQNKVSIFKYVEGTHMQASFDHLVGYGAGYYGYMWSKVYAEDLFSVFEKEGILNTKTGNRFRDEIISKGSTMDEMEMMKIFLKRDPNQDAFLKSMGL